MLKNFLYLNEPALEGYLSALEDGLRSSAEASKNAAKMGKAKAGIGPVGVEGSNESVATETVTRADTGSARFERLLQLAHHDPDAAGWIAVVDPENDLRDVGIGALIEMECEVYIPSIIKALAPSGELQRALGQLERLASIAPAFGADLSGMPPQSQLDALKGASSALGADATFVGDREDSNWRVAGRLIDDHLRGEIEGNAVVVGKVSAQWSAGKWKPLLALPGSNLLTREQKREMERKGPASDAERENWLQGPALMLDVLAIYR